MQGLTPLLLECAKYHWGLRGGLSLPTAPVSNACPRTRLQCHCCSCPSACCSISAPCHVQRGRMDLLVHTHQAFKAEAAQGDGTAQQTQRHCNLTASEVPKSEAREVKGLHQAHMQTAISPRVFDCLVEPHGWTAASLPETEQPGSACSQSTPATPYS